MEQHTPTAPAPLLIQSCALSASVEVIENGLEQIQHLRPDGTSLFPQTVRLSRRSVAFIEAEIDAWMAERIAARNVAA